MTVQVAEQVTAYVGRHRGDTRPVVQVTEHLAMVEGLWCQASVASPGDGWWSADGEAWLVTPPVTGAHAAVTS